MFRRGGAAQYVFIACGEAQGPVAGNSPVAHLAIAQAKFQQIDPFGVFQECFVIDFPCKRHGRHRSPFIVGAKNGSPVFSYRCRQEVFIHEAVLYAARKRDGSGALDAARYTIYDRISRHIPFKGIGRGIDEAEARGFCRS
jgi:hypothetical protein